MQATPTIKFTEHVGRWLRRAWAGVAYRETRVAHWLAACGVPVGVAKLLLLSVKAILIAVLLYSVFWLAVTIGVGWAMVRFAQFGVSSDTPEPEWRIGPAGYGLYTYDGHRIDPHVHDGEQ